MYETEQQYSKLSYSVDSLKEIDSSMTRDSPIKNGRSSGIITKPLETWKTACGPLYMEMPDYPQKYRCFGHPEFHKRLADQ